MDKFEYYTVVVNFKLNLLGLATDFPYQEIGEVLNEKGNEGWELVSSNVNTGYSGKTNEILLIFKRKI